MTETFPLNIKTSSLNINKPQIETIYVFAVFQNFMKIPMGTLGIFGENGCFFALLFVGDDATTLLDD